MKNWKTVITDNKVKFQIGRQIFTLDYDVDDGYTSQEEQQLESEVMQMLLEKALRNVKNG